jgi:hypothetical protein
MPEGVLAWVANLIVRPKPSTDLLKVLKGDTFVCSGTSEPGS